MIALGTLLHEALESEFLGSRGWPGVVVEHPDQPAVNVDALVICSPSLSPT